MSRTYPDDFDENDRTYCDTLTPDGSFVTQMLVVVKWMDADGEESWRCYNATNEGERAAACIGLLELAKLDIIARTDCGIPLNYSDGDDDDV